LEKDWEIENQVRGLGGERIMLEVLGEVHNEEIIMLVVLG